MILTTELSVSNESHSGSGPPQLFNKSKTENHHKTNGCCFLNGFIGILTMSDSQSDASRAMHQAVPLRKRRRLSVSEGSIRVRRQFLLLSPRFPLCRSTPRASQNLVNLRISSIKV